MESKNYITKDQLCCQVIFKKINYYSFIVLPPFGYSLPAKLDKLIFRQKLLYVILQLIPLDKYLQDTVSTISACSKSLILALAITTILRATAIKATIGFFPLAINDL